MASIATSMLALVIVVCLGIAVGAHLAGEYLRKKSRYREASRADTVFMGTVFSYGALSLLLALFVIAGGVK